jgi:uncharacterized repeat protein (TIGR01451 family)
VVGFSPALFTVNTAAFTPGSEGGSWSVSSSGGDLYLEYAPPAATDLRVSISSLSPTVDVGTAVSLTLTVSNSGPAAASYVYLTNRIPATASYVGSSPSGSLNGSLVSWRLTNLAVGASQGVTLNLTAPLVDGRYTNELVAAFAGSDANPANNTSAFVITATCPGAPVPFLHSGTVQSVLATHLLSFNVVSSNSDCGVPDLTSSTLPAGASLLGATNGYASTAAFSWTPLVTQTGVHLVRFYASNIGSATTSFVVRIHVGGAGESTNAAGIPLSQTNWHVSITNIEIPASGNVTVVWDAVEGITYDVYYSDHNLGGAMSWTRAVSGLEADSETEAAGVSGSASQRYFQVVPEGSLLSSNNLWAVIRPTVNASTFTLVSPGTAGDRAFDGALGSNLAQVLTGDNGGVGDNTGDEVLILEANQSWRNLYLSGSNTWNESNGSLSTFELAEGQGFYVLRNSGSTAQPRFTGPVGNLGTSTNVITDNSGNGGWNIITFSQGRHIPASTAFGSLAEGSPEADWDETQADLILVLNSNGSWRRIMRAGDGTWFDLTSFTTTGLYFGPGTAVFYYRQPVGTMRVRF